ncbi:MAG: minor capsid protein [Clostridia bacterium]|nr:minor capsid protein [Clostridia bacterium]
MIPARLLIHNCIYCPPEEIDRDGNVVFNEIELTGVRIVPALATTKATEGESKADRLTIYIDPEFSTPAIIPQELAQIKWNGKAYTIREVTPCYTQGSDAIHHYEAALV